MQGLADSGVRPQLHHEQGHTPCPAQGGRKLRSSRPPALPDDLLGGLLRDAKVRGDGTGQVKIRRVVGLAHGARQAWDSGTGFMS